MRRTVIPLAIALAAVFTVGSGFLGLSEVEGSRIAGNVAGQSEVSPRVSVWDGVYSKEQSARGRQAYDTSCASCHRADLAGANGRALVGTRFWQDWGEDTLQSLSSITRQTMPRGNAGSLPESTYLDITAYVLERNGYPDGANELTAESVLNVWVQRKEGPGPVPNYALVVTSGCLKKSGDVWSLTDSSEPVRTRNPDLEAEGSPRVTSGSHTFQLLDVFTSGDGHEGHRMEAKGLLIRGTPDRLNLTAMRMVADRCPP